MSAVAWATSWRAALRISRREVFRNKARNSLIVAMLGLPVLGVTAMETILNSTQDLTAQERLTRVVGASDAFIDPTQGAPIYQNTDVDPISGLVDMMQNPPSPSAAQLDSDTAIRAVLPHATLLAENVSYGVFVHGPAGYTTLEYYQLDFTNPAVTGAFDLTAGSLPRSATEVDLSPSVARELGARVGSTLTLPSSSMDEGKATAFTVVGLMQRPQEMTKDAVYALPGAPVAGNEVRQGWFVLNHGGVSWSQVEQLNKGGYRVVSSAVVLHPPAAAQVPGRAQLAAWHPSVSPVEIAITTIGVGIALLEIVLLAGPAFAVSARRREREYAMLGAVGADGGHLRRIVLADGVLLGAAAGVLGVALGYGAGAVTLAIMARHNSQLPGAVHVDVARVLGVALIAIVLGLCSALAPALAVSRRDILSALNGRRVAISRRLRTGRLVLGLVLIVLGTTSAYYLGGRSVSNGGVEIFAGFALVEIGGILCVPAIIRLLAHGGRVLPLGPRLALRDGARNSARTTPAVAAMFAAVAGAVAAGAWFESGLAQQRAAYQPMLLPNQAAVMGVTDAKQAAEITGKLRLLLPVTGSMLTQSVGAAGASGSWQVAFTTPGDVSQCPAATDNGISTVCGDGVYGGATVQEVVGGPQVFREVTGFDDARAESVLDQGGVVLFSPVPTQNGKVTIVVPPDGKGIRTTERATLPAVVLTAHGYPSPGFILAPKAARSLGIADGPRTLVLDMSSHVNPTQQFEADQLLDGFGVGGGLVVDIGVQSRLGLANMLVLLVAMFVTIGAAAIATGLALADGRADHDTLVAVGGSPWTRRWLAGSTALVVTGLGVLIGVPVGFLFAEGLIRVNNLSFTLPDAAQSGVSSGWRSFTVPWLDLGGLALAVPLLTALGAMLLSRSKAPGSSRPLG